MAAFVARDAFARICSESFNVVDILPSDAANSMQAWAILTPKA